MKVSAFAFDNALRFSYAGSIPPSRKLRRTSSLALAGRLILQGHARQATLVRLRHQVVQLVGGLRIRQAFRPRTLEMQLRLASVSPRAGIQVR
jgi:hypothetical protein